MIYPSTPENIKQAADRLKRGELVVFPTETVYGLGADAFNAEAVQKIFSLKNRPNFNPLIVHLFEAGQIELVADLSRKPELAALLSRLVHFWPGPLSLVLPKRKSLPGCVTAGLDSVAVRIPSHPIAQLLLKECGCPIAAPSANLSSEVSPTTAAHAEEGLGRRIDFILDGGACRVGLESTVLSLVESPPRLLRPGSVTLEQLQEVLGPVAKAGQVPETTSEIRSPGMLKRHYAPRTRIAFRGELAPSSFPPRVGLISFSTFDNLADEFDYAAVTCLSSRGDLQEVAARLFSSIRDLDKLELDLILVDTCPTEGIGLAIMDRLRRAAEED